MATGQTRQEILSILKDLGRAPVGDIEGRVDVKAITIRHHLNALQADGLITGEEQRQARGRSAYLYRLTLRGYRQFPHIYRQLVDAVMQKLREGASAAEIDATIEGMSGALAEQVRAEFANLTLEERLTWLLALLSEEGSIAHWRQTEEGLNLINFSCPFHDDDVYHPEFCGVKDNLIEIAIGGEIRRDCCVDEGDHFCSITIHPDDRASVVNTSMKESHD